jgi:transcriptional antiterminator RfaH
MYKSPWIVLYTKPNQETVAVKNIQRQKYEAYCPMILRTRRHARRVEQVERPLFPSYVFVKMNVRQAQWRSLLSTKGVRSLVHFGDQVGLLPEGFVEQLRASEENGVLDGTVAPRARPGDRVTLSEGPFESSMATVLSLPDRDRVWVLLDFMGRQVRVLQNKAALIPA